ncbi:MAG: hypothetical protein CML42_09580 [Rhodobacteraceae bacterium]|nr:hypothetical protein [Paracoccaceae bacterium]
MNQAINNDIKNNADNLKKSIQNEVNNISQTSMEMGRNISNTAKDAALKTEQLSRKTWSQAEGIANDARIRTTNKANELQEQAKNKANEIQEQAVTKGKEIQQQAIDTAKDVKENVEVAVLGKKEEGWFKNPLQFFKMPTLANITNKLSPKNLFCSSSTSSLPSINNTIDQFGGGGNGKKAINDLLQYNLVKREKILNILFEDIMIIVSTGKKVPKKKRKKSVTINTGS